MYHEPAGTQTVDALVYSRTADTKSATDLGPGMEAAIGKATQDFESGRHAGIVSGLEKLPTRRTRMGTIEFSHPDTELPPSAHYFPPSRGMYDVGPGFHNFGTGFGNDAADRRVFQVDCEFARFRQAKCDSRRERLDKYYRIHRYAVDQGETIARFMMRRLLLDYPAWFRQDGDEKAPVLHCLLTGEHLYFDSNMNLVRVETDGEAVQPAYVSALDALACQIQEDVAVISRDDAGRDWTCALHLCLPNHWSAEEKIGYEFAAIHKPVAGMKRINRHSRALVAAMIDKGPYVRFGWGLASDDRLNHHPAPPPGIDPATWRGRRFDAAQSHLFLRVERQVTWGFPAVSAGLFLIRTYITDLCEADQMMCTQLARALVSMTPEQLHYKGLDHGRDAILDYLRRETGS